MIDGNKTTIVGNTGVKPSTVTSQPLNNLYQSFSSSLQKKTNEPSSSKTTTINKCFVVTPTINHSQSLAQVKGSSSKSAIAIPTTSTTFVAFKPPIQKKIATTNNSIHRVEGGTIVVGNKQYQLVKGPSGQMRAIVNNTNTVVKPKPQPSATTEVGTIQQYIIF